jgi:hypothetical protein
MCGTIDPGHTYDEYLVLLAKLGMTGYSLSSRSFPPRVGARATAARAGTPLLPLVCYLARFTIALPPTQHLVAERGLVFISPPDEHIVARGGGRCPVVTSPTTVV